MRAVLIWFREMMMKKIVLCSAVALVMTCTSNVYAQTDDMFDARLRYLATIGEYEMLESEMRDIRRANPSWQMPGDLFTRPFKVNEGPIFDMIEQGERGAAEEQISKYQTNFPGWHPSSALQSALAPQPPAQSPSTVDQPVTEQTLDHKDAPPPPPTVRIQLAPPTVGAVSKLVAPDVQEDMPQDVVAPETTSQAITQEQTVPSDQDLAKPVIDLPDMQKQPAPADEKSNIPPVKVVVPPLTPPDTGELVTVLPETPETETPETETPETELQIRETQIAALPEVETDQTTQQEVETDQATQQEVDVLPPDVDIHMLTDLDDLLMAVSDYRRHDPTWQLPKDLERADARPDELPIWRIVRQDDQESLYEMLDAFSLIYPNWRPSKALQFQLRQMNETMPKLRQRSVISADPSKPILQDDQALPADKKNSPVRLQEEIEQKRSTDPEWTPPTLTPPDADPLWEQETEDHSLIFDNIRREMENQGLNTAAAMDQRPVDPPAFLSKNEVEVAIPLALQRKDTMRARLIGWYYYRNGAAKTSLDWFNRSYSWGDEQNALPGIVQSLLSLQELEQAETIAFREKDTSLRMAQTYRDLVHVMLTQDHMSDLVTGSMLAHAAAYATDRKLAGIATDLGWWYLHQDQWRTAEGWFTQALGWQPGHSKAAEGLFLTLLELDKMPEALIVAADMKNMRGRFLSVLPRARINVLEQVLIKYGQTDYPACLSLLRDETADSGYDAYSAIVKGWCLMGLGRNTEAEQVFSQAMDLDVDRAARDIVHQVALAGMVESVLERGMAESAINLLETYPLEDPGHDQLMARALEAKAVTAYESGQFKEVLDVLEQHAKLGVQGRELLMIKGHSLENMGQLGQARAVFADLDGE